MTDVGRVRAVIADDSADIRLLTKLALDLDGGFEVVGEAADGQHAVELVEQHRPALILLDLSMPVLDGLQAIPLIKKASPETLIVVVSGFDQGAMEDDVIALGAHGYLQKGIGADLVTRLRSLLSSAESPSPEPQPASTTTLTPPTERPPQLEDDVYRTIVRSLGQGVLLIDRSLRTLGSNEGAEALLSFTYQHDSDGEDDAGTWERVDAQGRVLQSMDTPVVAAFSDGRPRLDHLVGRRTNGSIQWVSVGAQPVGGGDGAPPSAMVVTGIDVSAQVNAETERLQAAEKLTEANRILEEADSSRRDFFAVTAHELRTPIAAITGLASLLVQRRDQISQEQSEEMLGAILHQGKRLELLAEDLLTAAKLEGGALRLDIERLEVCVAVQHALSAAGMNSADIELRCPEATNIDADPARVEQMLVNYLTNARKYGATPLIVDVRQSDDFVELRVSDGGKGVPTELIPRLFDRFSRASSATAPGTGLGLFIVKGLAEAHGGRAWYEPAATGGACFGIALPSALRTKPLDVGTVPP